MIENFNTELGDANRRSSLYKTQLERTSAEYNISLKEKEGEFQKELYDAKRQKDAYEQQLEMAKVAHKGQILRRDKLIGGLFLHPSKYESLRKMITHPHELYLVTRPYIPQYLIYPTIYT